MIRVIQLETLSIKETAHPATIKFGNHLSRFLCSTCMWKLKELKVQVCRPILRGENSMLWKCRPCKFCNKGLKGIKINLIKFLILDLCSDAING